MPPFHILFNLALTSPVLAVTGTPETNAAKHEFNKYKDPKGKEKTDRQTPLKYCHPGHRCSGTGHCRQCHFLKLLIEDGATLALQTGGTLTVHRNMVIGGGSSGTYIMMGGVTRVKGRTDTKPGAIIDIKAGSFDCSQ